MHNPIHLPPAAGIHFYRCAVSAVALIFRPRTLRTSTPDMFTRAIQRNSSFVYHRRRKPLKLGEHPRFGITYRYYVKSHVIRALRLNSTSTLETRSPKGYGSQNENSTRIKAMSLY